MSGPLVADLGLGPRVWLVLTLLSCLTLFFKFGRIWSVRNLDLLLLFAPAPGLMSLVGHGDSAPWTSFALLFLGSGLWLIRCLIDIGMTRRPMLEPNLNHSGLACLSIGILGLMMVEAVSLPIGEGAHRNPADLHAADEGRPAPAAGRDPAVEHVLEQAPLPSALRRVPPRAIVARVLATLAHLGLVAALLAVGWWHFDRPIAGLAVATCYLILPYPRIALVDGGQLIPSALIVSALVTYTRPALAGALIGLAAGWMPAALGLVPLWAGFYWGRGTVRFVAAGLIVVAACAGLGWNFPYLAGWARDLGARSLADVGLVPGVAAPRSGSFWTQIDPAYRLPVLIAYLALVGFTTFWPTGKNLGELIALSAALLVASQFWYLERGGTLVLLDLPLFLLMTFRPNLASKRARPLPIREPAALKSLFPVL